MEEKNKKRARAYNRLGDNYLRKDLLDDAIKAYLKAIQCDASCSIPHNNLGIIYSEQKRYPEAIEAFKNAILIDPNDASYYASLGTVYSEAGMDAIALETYMTAIRVDSKDYLGYCNLGAYYQSHGKFEIALGYYKNAVELKPGFAQGYVSIGRMYSYLSRSRPRTWRREQPAVCMDCISKVKQAIAAYTKALEIDPKCGQAYYAMGSLYKDIAHYEEAIETFNKFIAMNPESEDAEIAKGFIDEMQKLSNIDVRSFVDKDKRPY